MRRKGHAGHHYAVSPAFSYFLPLMPEYLPQQPILKHPQLMFFP